MVNMVTLNIIMLRSTQTVGASTTVVKDESSKILSAVWNAIDSSPSAAPMTFVPLDPALQAVLLIKVDWTLWGCWFTDEMRPGALRNNRCSIPWRSLLVAPGVDSQ